MREPRNEREAHAALMLAIKRKTVRDHYRREPHEHRGTRHRVAINAGHSEPVEYATLPSTIDPDLDTE